MRVLLLGRLADVAGWRERELEVKPSRLSELRDLLAAEPALAEALGRTGILVAVDKVLVRGDAPLFPNSEVAFMPPMSGG